MNGTLSSDTLHGCLSQNNCLSGVINRPLSLKGLLSNVTDSEAIYYDGDYVIHPSSKARTVLETKGKKMKGDVTINKIQYTEVSNLSGGTTVYIGE